MVKNESVYGEDVEMKIVVAFVCVLIQFFCVNVYAESGILQGSVNDNSGLYLTRGTSDPESKKGGLYFELGGRDDPDSFGGEIGFAYYVKDYLSVRGGLTFLASEGFDDNFTGGTLGVRMNIPHRFSPFVGCGVFGGFAREQVSAEDDFIDNDGDGSIDEPGETEYEVDNIIASIYPEAGIHYWATDTSRLTLSAKYHMTSEGRDNDFWLFCFGFTTRFD